MIIHDVKQGSEEWYLLRGEIPTGSEFSRLVTGTGKVSDGVEEYAIELAGIKMAGGKDPDGYKFGGNKHTDRGKELEPDANSTYKFIASAAVYHVGFITNDLMTYGVSPDGLIGDYGCVEYKCLTSKEFIKAARYYTKTGRCQPKYIPQTQGEIMVAERDWCDLVIYHPNYPILIIRQHPEVAFQETLKEQLEMVIIERNIIINEMKNF